MPIKMTPITPESMFEALPKQVSLNISWSYSNQTSTWEPTTGTGYVSMDVVGRVASDQDPSVLRVENVPVVLFGEDATLTDKQTASLMGLVNLKVVEYLTANGVYTPSLE